MKKVLCESYIELQQKIQILSLEQKISPADYKSLKETLDEMQETIISMKKILEFDRVDTKKSLIEFDEIDLDKKIA